MSESVAKQKCEVSRGRGEVVVLIVGCLLGVAVGRYVLTDRGRRSPADDVAKVEDAVARIQDATATVEGAVAKVKDVAGADGRAAQVRHATATPQPVAQPASNAPDIAATHPNPSEAQPIAWFSIENAKLEMLYWDKTVFDVSQFVSNVKSLGGDDYGIRVSDPDGQRLWLEMKVKVRKPVTEPSGAPAPKPQASANAFPSVLPPPPSPIFTANKGSVFAEFISYTLGGPDAAKAGVPFDALICAIDGGYKYEASDNFDRAYSRKSDAQEIVALSACTESLSVTFKAPPSPEQLVRLEKPVQSLAAVLGLRTEGAWTGMGPVRVYKFR